MRQRTERVQVRFPDRLKKQIEQMAAEQQITQGEIVVQLVERALSHDPREMNQQIIALHETVASLLARIEKLEQEENDK